MARKSESPIVEVVRQEAHEAGVLDQRYKDILKGYVAQSTRNITKSLEPLRGGKENLSGLTKSKRLAYSAQEIRHE